MMKTGHMKICHLLLAAGASLALSAKGPAAAQEVVIGLNTVMSGVLKTVGELRMAIDLLGKKQPVPH